jgi:iron(III) transport system ATP-binding protein
MLKISDLTKVYAEAESAAVDGVSLSIPAGSFFTLLGPSGCGKSTLLRSVAGLEKPNAGEIVVGGETMFSSYKNINVSPNRRRFGMVFQSYAVWPHMTVFENVAFPLEVQRQSGVRKKVMKVLEMVGLAELHDRYAPNLSGGQQQRVAFARAVVAEPAVLLLDEPLSNLDAALREQMRSELRQLQKRLGVTSVYVTHDQSESLSMSDQIAVMSAGKVLEIGTPGEIYQRPKREFSARFVGGGNIIKGTINGVSSDPDTVRVDTPIGPICAAPVAEVTRGDAYVLIRPENVHVVHPGQARREGQPTYSGKVVDYQFVGLNTELTVELAQGVEVRLRVPGLYEAGLAEVISIEFDEEWTHLIAPD